MTKTTNNNKNTFFYVIKLIIYCNCKTLKQTFLTMKLRNGKTYQSCVVEGYVVEVEQKIKICKLLKNIINHTPSFDLGCKETIINVTRGLHELYYNINYYDLINIPPFKKFIDVAKKKANEYIIILTFILTCEIHDSTTCDCYVLDVLHHYARQKSSRIILTGDDKTNAENLLNLLNDFIKKC